MKLADNKRYWKSLPWNKIFLRIQMLVNQIFIETKKHNLKRVQSLQNYIVNCNELKILVLNKTIPKLYILYYIHNKRYDFLDNSFNSILIKNLFFNKKHSSKNFATLKTLIKQSLIYICTRPLFEARLSRYTNNNTKLYIASYLVSKKKYYYYLSNKYIQKKIVLPKYIRNSLIDTLNRINYLDIFKLYKSRHNKNLDSHNYLKYLFNLENLNFLIQILTQFILPDSNWYNFSTIKKERYGKKSYKRTKQIKKDMTYLLKSFKFYLKLRFLINKLKISNYIFTNFKLYSLDKKINYLYYIWYDSINNFINLYSVTQCHLLMNQVLNLVLKKTISNSISYKNKIYKVNTSLNKLTYLFNLNSYYSSY